MSTRSQARVRTSWSKADAFVPGNRQRQISPGERENQLHIHRSDNLLTVFSVIRLAGLERVREQSPEEYSQLHTNTAAQHMRAPASSIQAPRLRLSWASAALDPGVSVAAGAIWSAEEQRSPPGLSETSHLRKKPSQQGGGGGRAHPPFSKALRMATSMSWCSSEPMWNTVICKDTRWQQVPTDTPPDPTAADPPSVHPSELSSSH